MTPIELIARLSQYEYAMRRDAAVLAEVHLGDGDVLGIRARRLLAALEGRPEPCVVRGCDEQARCWVWVQSAEFGSLGACMSHRDALRNEIQQP